MPWNEQRGLGAEAPIERGADVVDRAVVGRGGRAVVVVVAPQLPEFEVDAPLGAPRAVGEDAPPLGLAVTIGGGRERIVGRAARIHAVEIVGAQVGAQARAQIEIGQAVDVVAGVVVRRVLLILAYGRAQAQG